MGFEKNAVYVKQIEWVGTNTEQNGRLSIGFIDRYLICRQEKAPLLRGVVGYLGRASFNAMVRSYLSAILPTSRTSRSRVLQDSSPPMAFS